VACGARDVLSADEGEEEVEDAEDLLESRATISIQLSPCTRCPMQDYSRLSSSPSQNVT